jgi:hypothetical protein
MRLLSDHDASQFVGSINLMNDDNHREQRTENREEELIYF